MAESNSCLSVALTSFVVFICGYSVRGAEYKSIWTDISNTGIKDYHVTNASTWWERAGQGCGDGHLFLPHSTGSLSQEVVKMMRGNTLYWVGGVQNSHWEWTDDDSPLYEYVGQSDPPNTGLTEVPGNTAFKCHIHCQDSPLLGLRGDECYCLSESDVSISSSRKGGVRCSGNWQEFCGTEDKISVYKADTIPLEAEEDGQCGYVVKSGRTVVKIQLDNDCDSQKRYQACDKPVGKPNKCKGDLCTYRKSSTWEDSNEGTSCSLLKVTNDNRNNLLGAMATYQQKRAATTSYWIGLRRHYSWRWINRSQIETEFSNSDDHDVCLAVKRKGSKVSFSWISCDKKLRAICQSERPATTPLVYTTEQGVTPADNYTLVTAAMSSDSNAGVIAGAVIGCLLGVAAFVVVAFILKRKRKLCFSKTFGEKCASMSCFSKTFGEKGVSKEFDNLAYNSEDPYYSTPASSDTITTPIPVLKPPKAAVKPAVAAIQPPIVAPKPQITSDKPAVKPPVAVIKPTVHRSDYENGHMPDKFGKQTDDTYYSTVEHGHTSAVKQLSTDKDPVYMNDPEENKYSSRNNFADHFYHETENPNSHPGNVHNKRSSVAHYNHIPPNNTSPSMADGYTEAGEGIPFYLDLEGPHGFDEPLYNDPEGQPQVGGQQQYSLAAELQNRTANNLSRGPENYSALDLSASTDNVYNHIEGGARAGEEIYDVADAPQNVSVNIHGSELYSLAGQGTDGSHHEVDSVLDDPVYTEPQEGVYCEPTDYSTA